MTNDFAKLEKQLLARVQRANALSEQLSKSIDVWTSAQSFTPAPQIAPDRLSWELTVEVSEPPLDDWSSLYGDAIHNLRSTLDNLAWGLTSASGREPTHPKRVAFPIVDRSGAWKKQSQCIAELPAAARSAIRNIQPFQRRGIDGTPHQDPLLLLKRLSNTDKHRVAIGPLFNPTVVQASFAVEFQSEADAVAEAPPQIEVFGYPFTNRWMLHRQVTKHAIVNVVGACHIEAEAVVIDDVLGRLGITQSLAGLVTYIPQVITYVLGEVAQHAS